MGRCWRGGALPALPALPAWLGALVALTVVAVGPVSSDDSNKRVVCYYTNWSVYRPGTAKFSPQNINPYLCTHLIYAFGGLTRENGIRAYDKYQDIEQGGYAKFTGLKTYNKQLKTLLAIGGWNEGSARFSPMVADAERRAEFVKNAVRFLRTNHFDGLDLDWEYPAYRDGGKPADRDNYAALVQELREEFDREAKKTGRPRLLLTMAVPAGIEYIDKGYDVPRLNKYLDFMNILSYDYHSAFESAVNHHSPLYPLGEDDEYNFEAALSIDYTVKHYIKMGASRDKLVLGIPTYGRSYTLFNPDSTALGAPSDGPGEQGDATREKGYLAYYEICEAEGWKVEKPHPKAMGPYAVKGNQWVGYDDTDIVRLKAEYVNEKGLGGIMFWSIDNDDFRGKCHNRPYPLIEAAKEALLGAKPGSDERNQISSKPSKKSHGESSTARSDSAGSSTRRTNKLKTKAPPRRTSTTSTSTSTSTTTGNPLTTPEPPSTPDPGSDFVCKDEGFFPHPRDCKKYFWCLDSGPSNLGIVAHQFTCPSGLFFNKAADSCDYARNVICSKKSAAPASTTASPPSTTASSPSSGRTTTTTTTTTTTEAPIEEEEEEEVEEEVEDEDGGQEDPEALKELLNLIKKLGGVEELEKQLRGDKSSGSSAASESPSSGSSGNNLRNRSLVERVLQGRNRHAATQSATSSTGSSTGSSTPRYKSLFRNGPSRPQNDGLQDGGAKDSSASQRERPKYVSIRRERPAAAAELEEAVQNEPEETAVEARTRNRYDKREEDNNDSGSKPAVPEYITLRRNRPAEEADVTTSRYVTLHRSRPSTTTEAALSSQEDDDADDDAAEEEVEEDDSAVAVVTPSPASTASPYREGPVYRPTPQRTTRPASQEEEDEDSVSTTTTVSTSTPSTSSVSPKVSPGARDVASSTSTTSTSTTSGTIRTDADTTTELSTIDTTLDLTVTSATSPSPSPATAEVVTLTVRTPFVVTPEPTTTPSPTTTPTFPTTTTPPSPSTLPSSHEPFTETHVVTSVTESSVTERHRIIVKNHNHPGFTHPTQPTSPMPSTSSSTTTSESPDSANTLETPSSERRGTVFARGRGRNRFTIKTTPHTTPLSVRTQRLKASLSRLRASSAERNSTSSEEETSSEQTPTDSTPRFTPRTNRRRTTTRRPTTEADVDEVDSTTTTSPRTLNRPRPRPARPQILKKNPRTSTTTSTPSTTTTTSTSTSTPTSTEVTAASSTEVPTEETTDGELATDGPVVTTTTMTTTASTASTKEPKSSPADDASSSERSVSPKTYRPPFRFRSTASTSSQYDELSSTERSTEGRQYITINRGQKFSLPDSSERVETDEFTEQPVVVRSRGRTYAATPRSTTAPSDDLADVDDSGLEDTSAYRGRGRTSSRYRDSEEGVDGTPLGPSTLRSAFRSRGNRFSVAPRTSTEATADTRAPFRPRSRATTPHRGGSDDEVTSFRPRSRLATSSEESTPLPTRAPFRPRSRPATAAPLDSLSVEEEEPVTPSTRATFRPRGRPSLSTASYAAEDIIVEYDEQLTPVATRAPSRAASRPRVQEPAPVYEEEFTSRAASSRPRSRDAAVVTDTTTTSGTRGRPKSRSAPTTTTASSLAAEPATNSHPGYRAAPIRSRGKKFNVADLIRDAGEDDNEFNDVTTRSSTTTPTRTRGKKFSVSTEELEGATGDDFPTSRYKGGRQRLAAARSRSSSASSAVPAFTLAPAPKPNELRRLVEDDSRVVEQRELLLTLEDSDHFDDRGRVVKEKKKATKPTSRGSIKAKESLLADEAAFDNSVRGDDYDYDLLTLPTTGYDQVRQKQQQLAAPADQTSIEDTRNESYVDAEEATNAELNDVLGNAEVSLRRPGGFLNHGSRGRRPVTTTTTTSTTASSAPRRTPPRIVRRRKPSVAATSTPFVGDSDGAAQTTAPARDSAGSRGQNAASAQRRRKFRPESTKTTTYSPRDEEVTAASLSVSELTTERGRFAFPKRRPSGKSSSASSSDSPEGPSSSAPVTPAAPADVVAVPLQGRELNELLARALQEQQEADLSDLTHPAVVAIHTLATQAAAATPVASTPSPFVAPSPQPQSSSFTHVRTGNSAFSTSLGLPAGDDIVVGDLPVAVPATAAPPSVTPRHRQHHTAASVVSPQQLTTPPPLLEIRIPGVGRGREGVGVARRLPQPLQDDVPRLRATSPQLDYEYYDDEVDAVPSATKVKIHGDGWIECLDRGNFPHPFSCRKFISCAKMESGELQGWEYTCPRGLSFDPIGGICNWSAGLGCKA